MRLLAPTHKPSFNVGVSLGFLVGIALGAVIGLAGSTIETDQLRHDKYNALDSLVIASKELTQCREDFAMLSKHFAKRKGK